MSKLAHSNQDTMDEIDRQKAFAELSFNEAFGMFAKRKRRSRGWTQEQLAQKVGKSRTTITNIECGRQGQSFEDGLRMMHILGLPVEACLPHRDYMIV